MTQSPKLDPMVSSPSYSLSSTLFGSHLERDAVPGNVAVVHDIGRPRSHPLSVVNALERVDVCVSSIHPHTTKAERINGMMISRVS